MALSWLVLLAASVLIVAIGVAIAVVVVLMSRSGRDKR